MIRFVIRFGVLIAACSLADLTSAAEVRFNEQIRPILAEYCIECHGPDAGKREGDLRLDVADEAQRVFASATRQRQ